MERSLLEWSIRAVLMVVGTAAVVSVLRMRAASLLHRAWTAAMVAMLLLPVWTKWGPSVTARVLPVARERATSASPVRPEIAPAAATPPAEWSQTSTVPPPSRTPGPGWRQILLAIYLTGLTVMLARLIRGTLQVRWLMRAVRQEEGFVTAPLCAAPVTVGWLRPVLLLPDCWRTWPAAKLQAVLTHEREHVRRRDPLVQWLALLNRCVFWFHPLAWWLERKLVALAEEACDMAVLAAGHSPHDYAHYLIDMAHLVRQNGTSIRPAGAVAFSDRQMSGRIRRILDSPPVGAASSGKSIAAAILCGVMLITFLACRVGPSRPAASREAMKEQESQARTRLREQRAQQQQNDALLWKVALGLTPTSAKNLETDLKAHPDDRDKLLELVRYYQSKSDWRSLNALTFWYIAHHPDSRQGWWYRPVWDKVWDQDGYEQGRQLWTDQLKQSWTSPYVYMNAAEYLSGNDNEQAEQIFVEGRRKFPSIALHWEVLLARHYAWALTGSAGQMPDNRNVVGYDESAAPPAQTPYAMKVRQALLESTDVELLTRTVEQLQGSRPNLAFAQSLIDRVLSIQPDNRQAHLQREGLRRFPVYSRAKTNPGSLSDADRMVVLESELRRPDGKDAEANATELLALASRNPKDPDYGTAIFLANLALGEAALSRGDKPEAVRRMMAASDAPVTEFLRYNQIDMSLPRKLVDAGERDAVTTFLDRCAKFNQGGKPLAQWAAQIRKGSNPNLAPNFDIFRQTR